MQAERIERKYALTKIDTGDWLLPSNDGKTLWRICRYVDGPSGGLDEWPRDRTFWGTWRWTGVVEEGAYFDVSDWDRWEKYDGFFSTRADAIAGALAVGS